MSKRLNKKQKKNGSSRKSLERKNIKLTTEIEELDKTLNGYQKVKKELEKELTELRVYESEFRQATDKKMQNLINSIDNLEHTIKEELKAKEKAIEVQIMIVEENFELEKTLEKLTKELEKYKNVTGIKRQILKVLNI